MLRHYLTGRERSGYCKILIISDESQKSSLTVFERIDFMAKENKGDTPDKDFLEYMIKALVDHPEDVKIDRKVDEMGVLLSLKVNPEDMGQVIGKGGSTARAIRSLVRIVGLKNHARVNLKIEEPEGSRTREGQKKVGEDLEELKL